MLAACAVSLLATRFAAPCAAADLSPDQRMSDFNQLAGILRSSYSMIEYKKQVLGVDLEQLVPAYAARVKAVANDDQFYDLLSAFIAELKDAHTKHLRPSTMSARLGFTLRRIEGKAIITAIDTKVLAPGSFPFHIGDEVVALSGKPVAQLLRERRPFLSSGREESALGKIVRLMASPMGKLGPVPTGMCRVEIRPHGKSDIQAIELPWIVTGRPLPGLSFHGGAGASGTRIRGLVPGERNPDACLDPIDAADEGEGLPAWAPMDGIPVPSPLFPAAMVDSPKGLIGYLRIPTFSPDSTEDAIKELRQVLAKLKLTRGLILDLTDNPGGSVTYGLTVAGMLTDRMLDLPKKAERANRSTLTQYRELADTTNPARRAMAEYHGAEIEKAMEAGLALTPPMTLWYRPSQAPDAEVHYTKPLLVLINDQSYSCADLLPSVLKDNGRATLFGSTTAGAGGSVSQYGPLAFCGSMLSVTINVTQRVSGKYIENMGVEPDVSYDLTQDDVAGSYAGYRRAYTAALMNLMH